MIISGHPEYTVVWMLGYEYSFGLGLSLLSHYASSRCIVEIDKLSY